MICAPAPTPHNGLSVRHGYLCVTCEVAGEGVTCWICQRPATLDGDVRKMTTSTSNGSSNIDSALLLWALARLQAGGKL